MWSNSRNNCRHINNLLTQWILLNLLFSGCLCDICSDPTHLTPELMSKYLHTTSIPRGQLYAGFYEEDKTAAGDPAQCILSCCDKPLCNVAWFTHEQCFTIECNPLDERACTPVKKSEPQFNSTLFIQVRTTEETSESDECQLLSPKNCGDNEICLLTKAQTTRCVCEEGYSWKDIHTKICVPDDRSGDLSDNKEESSTLSSILSQTTVSPMECEIGLFQCRGNRICKPLKDPKSRNGVCQCRTGYSEDGSGDCVADKGVVGSDDVDKMDTSGDSDVTPVGTQEAKTTLRPSTTSRPTPKVQILTVSAGDDKEIQLPENSVSLKAFAMPKDAPEDPYHYVWSLEAHPEGEQSGIMDGKTTDTLKLSQLIEGLYTFKVQVTGTNKFGEASVNVTVKPPARENKPPVAIITPAYLEMKLPNSAILDGSDSTDDDKIVSYHWEEVSGPLTQETITGDKAIFNLENLSAGNYTFKLTVTDSDGLTNSTTANVTAIKETDYPPKANAGSDVVIHLPQNSVVLSGNMSTDDKGIVSYEWIKASGDTLAVDTQGARTPNLHLSNLEVGDYTFTLKVTDSAGQTSSADVHVYVKPEQNTPPEAITQATIEASLPLDNILLDGSNSTDDLKITSYLWQQTGGPTILDITDADKAVANAGGEIKVGKYTFKLTVKDAEELASSSVTEVVVKQVANEPPVARAGDDVVVQLPQVLVTLDGSKSSDDHKITSYLWVRGQNSLAAGDVLNNSDHQAVLQLVNLVEGRYVFTLKVTDGEGLTSKDSTSIVVKDEEDKTNLLELILEADITQFTEENKKNLEGQLALLLPKSSDGGDTVVSIRNLQSDPATGNLRVLFYAMNVMRDTRIHRTGVETLVVLKKKLLSSPYVLEFKVIGVDTLVCQNNCSNHGHCDLKTKLCICEAFWTQNVFLYLANGESNCDWSILYVVIVCFLVVLAVTGLCWTLVCCWQRRRCRCRLRPKKRHRYSLLQDEDDENDNIEMKKGKIQNSSVMISESDFSSEEEETIFVNQKKTNGHLGKLNGISKQHLKTKLKT